MPQKYGKHSKSEKSHLNLINMAPQAVEIRGLKEIHEMPKESREWTFIAK